MREERPSETAGWTVTAWYASGGGIAQAGPFATEHEAREAFRLTEEARGRQRRERGTASPYPWDLVVWPDDAARTRPPKGAQSSPEPTTQGDRR